MAKRVKLVENDENEEVNSYFTSQKTGLSFVHSGAAVLDCVLGGGYVLGRMINIVGDKSTAKTALACEAVTNFLHRYPDGVAAYREIEAAFDKEYAAEMNMPVDQVDFGDEELGMMTVEEFHKDLSNFLDERAKDNLPGIYIIDSFDALSDDDEQKRDIDKGSYGMAKQKKIGVLFRQLIRKLEKTNVLLIIISQVRENINAMFGEKHRRSGGKALDFYASQIIWLNHMKTLKKTIKGVERAYGIQVQVKCKKNKIGFPFRDCIFTFLFGYGVDDITSNLDWLKSVKKLDALDIKESALPNYKKSLDELSPKELRKERKRISKAVVISWNEIETTFLPKRRKEAI